MVRTSLLENFKHESKNDMDANMATLFVRGALRRSSFLGNLKPLNLNLTSKELQIETFFELLFPSCLPYQPLLQIVLSWGGNS